MDSDIKSECSDADIRYNPFIFLKRIGAAAERADFDLCRIETCTAGRTGYSHDRKTKIGRLFDNFPQTHVDPVGLAEDFTAAVVQAVGIKRERNIADTVPDAVFIHAGIKVGNIHDLTQLFRDRLTALADGQFLRILAVKHELQKRHGLVTEVFY